MPTTGKRFATGTTKPASKLATKPGRQQGSGKLPRQVRAAMATLENFESSHGKGQPSGARKPQSRRSASKRRWVTEENTANAGPPPDPAQDDEPRTSFWEQQRQAMIRERNRLRRRPWIPAAGSIALGAVGHSLTGLYSWAGVPTDTTAAVIAGVPAAATAVIVAKVERHHRRAARSDNPLAPTYRAWIPAIALSGVASAGIVFWIALEGLNPAVLLVAIVTTLAVGSRWWKQHPIGPDVPRLEPPRPAPEPEPETETVPGTDLALRDEAEVDFAALWDKYNARGKGKAPNSRLTGRDSTDFAVSYCAELDRGVQTPRSLRAVIPELASGLGVPAGRLIVEDDPEESGEHIARITIITKDPVADIRYYAGPKITATPTSGIVHSTGRYGDGQGDQDVVMWNEAGMVPTAVIGATRSGKSSVVNIVVDGGMETGLLNLLYLDPKGISSAELADVARIAILGPENVARAPELINAIVEARRAYGIKHRLSKMNPTPELPGWMVVHDEFSELVNRGYRAEALAWTSLVNTIAALGFWVIAINQAMQEAKWGDDQCRQAFCTQMIVMRMRTTSDKLIPGLELSPSSLPNRKGIGVYAYDQASRSNVPVQADYLPEPGDAANHPDAPLTTAAAFAQSSKKQPPMPSWEVEAIVSVLGEPVDGRWVVGPGGTHRFPDPDEDAEQPTAKPTTSAGQAQKGTGGWAKKLLTAIQADTVETLEPNAQRVLGVIMGGITKPSEIVQAMSETMSRPTVYRALNELVGADRIHRGKGGYVAGPAPDERGSSA